MAALFFVSFLIFCVVVVSAADGDFPFLSSLRRPRHGALPSSSSSLPSSNFTPSNVKSLYDRYNFTGVVHIWKHHTASEEEEKETQTQKPIAEYTFGHANIEATRPMKPDAVFPIGSNTKLMTAVSLYQLQEQGKLNLTQDISDLITPSDLQSFGFPPSVTRLCLALEATPTKCERITLTDILGMQSGLGNGNSMWEFLPYLGSLSSMVAQFIQYPLRYAPRKGYFYSNAGYAFAAWFVEKYSGGVSFNRYLQKNIFDVVGMPDTKMDMYNGQLGYDNRRVGEFYHFIQQEQQSSSTIKHQTSPPSPLSEVARGRCSAELGLGAINGAGGVLSTQADVAKWYFTIFNFSAANGGKLLASHQTLVDIVNPTSPPPYPIGGGWCYAQGIAVACPDILPPFANGAPQQISYMGGTMCSRTANFMAVTSSSNNSKRTTTVGRRTANEVGTRSSSSSSLTYTLFQSYQSTVVYPTNQTTLDYFGEKAEGSIFEVLGELVKLGTSDGLPYPDPMHLTFELAALYDAGRK